MITSENRIIEDIRGTILREELRNLKDDEKLDDYFENELNIFKFFKNFEMNEVTAQYINLYEKLMDKIAEKNFNEENLKELREKFKKEEKLIEMKVDNMLQGRFYIINKHGNLEIIDRYEKLSFSIYHYYKELSEKINEKTETEKTEIYNNSVLIHNYLRENSFAAVADAVADVKLACK
jgi:hypothetical protein|nr:MAG TPA: hypothetical protein [Caudoviricetes sp.]